MKRFLLLFSSLLPLLGLIVFLKTMPVQANQVVSASFTVNNTLDATDDTPGDGVCETAPGNGVCTLRAAVQETNALSGTDVIQLPAGVYSITIPGIDFDAAVGDLNIRDNLTILGEGNEVTIVDGNQLDRVFDVRMSANKRVTLAHMTIQNGINPSGMGGGLCHCTTDTYLTLDQVVIQDSYGASGGGIYNVGHLVVMSSTVQNNVSANNGGGIFNEGTAVISNTIILSNTAPNDGLGGGIYNNGVLHVDRSAIAANAVQIGGFGSNGGGIFNNAAAQANISNSTISHNSAQGGYGGFANWGGTVELVNVTVSQNESGGILQYSGGSLTITNTSVVSNSHLLPWTVSLRVESGMVTMKNSIIAGTTADNCLGTIVSAGNNLDSGNSCGFNSTGDLVNTNPILGLLQNNGGETQTHALLFGSPAIDAGDMTGCPIKDQRGVARPQWNGCDMGAFEYVPLGATAVADTITTSKNTPVLIDALANDVAGDFGSPVLSSVEMAGNGTAVISGTYIFYTPTPDFAGTDVFSYTISDTQLMDTAFITVTVLDTQTRLYLPFISKSEN